MLLALPVQPKLLFEVRSSLLYHLSQIKTALQRFSAFTENDERFVILDSFSAYIMFKSELNITWESAQLAFASVLKQKGRQFTYRSVEKSSQYMR